MLDNVKIPQDVRVEDKIIGPLSLKQIILVVVGAGFSYALFAILQKSIGYVPVVAHLFIWLPGLLAAAFALVRINDISLFRYCLLLIESMSKPRVRPWLPREGIVINIQTRPPRWKSATKSDGQETVGEKRDKAKNPGQGKGVPMKTTIDLVSLTHLLDTGGRDSPLVGVDSTEDREAKSDGPAAPPRAVDVDPLVLSVDSLSTPSPSTPVPPSP